MQLQYLCRHDTGVSKWHIKSVALPMKCIIMVHDYVNSYTNLQIIILKIKKQGYKSLGINGL